MKRTLCIIAAFAVTAAAAGARDYTYLQPPSIAVADFEVSMSSADKEASKAFYGELVSQALLSALVQQNSSAVSRVSTADASPFADKGVSAANTGGEAVRYYFPPLFKLFDKRYVESALQNATYASKDLYTKSAGAFNFADLDYIVLGNVYRTRRTVGNAATDAVGINVRVLNTRRSEELYSYTEVVNDDLSDLPAACVRICRNLIRDILTHTCAQFTISDVSGVNTPYRLFWQPKQVEKDDNTVADSDDASKRELNKDQFYWVLPGQYLISVYNVGTQRIHTIPFSVSAGDLKHLTIGRQDMEAELGTLTIAGVLPLASYRFSVTEQERREQYWWEVGAVKTADQSFTVTFSGGGAPEVKSDSGAAAAPHEGGVRVEYRAATNEIVIRNIMLSSYDISATVLSPSSNKDIAGSWKVSTRETLQSSMPLLVDLQAQNDAHLKVSDFALNQVNDRDFPHKTEVTFYLNPGFGYDMSLNIDDGSAANMNWLSWKSKEKVTIESEYSQEEWASLPEVKFTFYPTGTFAGVSGLTFERKFLKADLDPSNDTVVIVDLNNEAANWKKQRGIASTDETPETTAVPPAPVSTAEAPRAASPSPAIAAKTAVSGTRPSSVFLGLSGGIGYGIQTYYAKSGSKAVVHSAGGLEIGANIALAWYVTPGFGLGLGGAFHDCVLSTPSAAAVVTADVIFGNLATQSIAFMIEGGIGAGYMVDAGLAFMNEEKTVGFLFRAGLVSYDISTYDITVGGVNYPAAAGGFYLGFGALLGL